MATKKIAKFDIKKLKRLPEKNLEEARRIFGNLKRRIQKTRDKASFVYLQNIRENIKIKK